MCALEDESGKDVVRRFPVDQMSRDAAILIPLYRSVEGEMHVVLVRRSEGGIHGGQLAFPGGKHEKRDMSMMDTALREAREEIGLETKMVKIIVHLPIVETKTTEFRVFPFLAGLAAPGKWCRSEREVTEIIDVKLSDLAQPEAHDREIEHFPTWPEPREISFYRVGPYRLWGLSYRILQPLIPSLLAGEWPI